MLRGFFQKRAPLNLLWPRPPHFHFAWVMHRGFTYGTPSQMRPKSNNGLKVQHSVPPSQPGPGHGILTVCPSPPAFAIGLGPTNPSLISIAKETLIFRRARISLALRLLVPTFSLPIAPVWVTPLPSSQLERSPTTYCVRRHIKSAVSVLRLAPIIFGARSLSE